MRCLTIGGAEEVKLNNRSWREGGNSVEGRRVLRDKLTTMANAKSVSVCDCLFLFRNVSVNWHLRVNSTMRRDERPGEVGQDG